MEKFLPIVNRNECRKIKLEDIVYLERQARLIRVVTEDASYYEYAKLSDFQPYIEGDSRFFPCMKRLVINFDQVMSMKDQMIYFKNGMKCDLGRTNYLKTKQSFANYLRSKEQIH